MSVPALPIISYLPNRNYLHDDDIYRKL